MDRVNNIIKSRVFRLYLQKNRDEEETRLYCTHDFKHYLDAARLTYILLLEGCFPYISREMAYAAGLLHDIGRWKEYQTGEDHAAVSAELADPILAEAEFSRDEIAVILKAISEHRTKENGGEHRSPLSLALSRADDLSRLCFDCNLQNSCKKLDQQPHKEGLIR